MKIIESWCSEIAKGTKKEIKKDEVLKIGKTEKNDVKRANKKKKSKWRMRLKQHIRRHESQREWIHDTTTIEKEIVLNVSRLGVIAVLMKSHSFWFLKNLFRTFCVSKLIDFCINSFSGVWSLFCRLNHIDRYDIGKDSIFQRWKWVIDEKISMKIKYEIRQNNWQKSRCKNSNFNDKNKFLKLLLNEFDAVRGVCPRKLERSHCVV